jgi:hypothetical protein
MGDQIKYNRIILKSGQKYFAICPEFVISVDSASTSSAIEALNLEVTDFLKSAKKDRQLDSILEDAGYTHEKDKWIALQMLETGTETIEI